MIETSIKDIAPMLVIPSRADLVGAGLTQSQARLLYTELVSLGGVKISSLKALLVSEAEAEFNLIKGDVLAVIAKAYREK